MPTVIGVTGEDLALPAPDQPTPPAVVLAPPGRQSLDAALTVAESALETGGHLVVVVPTGLAPEHRGRLRAVRSLLESHRTALVEVDLPPLATALLARQLRQISRYDLGPGVIASAARLLTHYLHTGAVLGSVAGLDRVPVGFGSHLRSFVPGTRFAVLAAPAPALTPFTDGIRLPGPDFVTELAFTAGGSGEEWVRDRLAADWRCRYAHQVPLPEESARWWGTARLVEFAAYIADVGVLYHLVNSAHREPCPWCGLELVGDRCAFCSSPIAQHAPPVAPSDRRTG